MHGMLEQDIISGQRANWVKTTNNDLGASTHVNPISIAIYPYKSFTQLIFLGEYGYYGRMTMRSGGIYQSSDGGAHWHGLALEHVLF